MAKVQGAKPGRLAKPAQALSHPSTTARSKEAGEGRGTGVPVTPVRERVESRVSGPAGASERTQASAKSAKYALGRPEVTHLCPGRLHDELLKHDAGIDHPEIQNVGAHCRY